MCKNTGCFGSFIRIVLSLINIVFLLFNLGIFLFAVELKRADTSELSDEKIGSVFAMIIEILSLVMFILGPFMVALSYLGLIGACCANRFFLVLYEIVLVVLFLSHGILLIIGGAKSPEVEREFRDSLVTIVEKIKHSRSPRDECVVFFLVSKLFTCCGAGSPADFNKTQSATCCIQPMPVYGCSERAVSMVKHNIIIVPSSIILSLEFILILAVPFLIGRITSSSSSSSSASQGRRNELEEEHRMINA
jgi:hypothetical protein